MKFTDIPTYRAAVAQSRAQRALKIKVSELLKTHSITMMQWSIIGLVFESGKDGMRISDLAKELNTSMAFITTIVNMLEAKSVVEKTNHERDSRAKVVRLSESFKPKVKEIETQMHSQLDTWLNTRADKNEIGTYFTVLNRLAENKA